MSPKGRHGDIPLLGALERSGPLADSLWGKLAYLDSTAVPLRVLFVGTEDGAGATTMAGAAALGLAQNLQVEVNLIEANLARPGLATALGMEPTPGLSELLQRREALDACRRPVKGCERLSVITAGGPRNAIPGEFATEHARSVLAEITGRGRFAIFDAPPLLTHPETRVLLEYVDGVILVLRARVTRRADAVAVKRILEDCRLPIFGSIFNRYKSDVPFGIGDKY